MLWYSASKTIHETYVHTTIMQILRTVTSCNLMSTLTGTYFNHYSHRLLSYYI